jgi:hypothetical protein
MTQRKKGKKLDPKPEAISEAEASIGRYPGEVPDERPRNADYWRGWEEAQQAEAAKRREAKQEKASEESVANSRISIEFGDGTVTFRDGLDRIIKRDGLTNWTLQLGGIMAERNCTNVGCRMGEHAMFTARQTYKLLSAAKSEKARQAGVGPGMDFQNTGGRGSREVE